MHDAAGAADRPPRPTRPLSERERALLDFERDWQRHEGKKEAAIREQFEFSPARYYQLLSRLVDTPAAHAHDPLLIARLRRRRDERARRRAGGTLGRGSR